MANTLFKDANRHLYNRRPEKALSLYTQILVEVDLGHPIAFLGRSLCHIALEQPASAVMDAYRAYLAITFADDDGDRRRIVSSSTQILHYTLMCEQATGETWTHLPAYMLELTGSYPPTSMANIHLSPERPDPRSPGKVLQPIDLNDAKLKALYRLVYALWKLSGGALSTALSILDRLTHESDDPVLVPAAISSGKVLLSADHVQGFRAIRRAIWLDIEGSFLSGNNIRSITHRPGGLFATQHAIVNLEMRKLPTRIEINRAIRKIDPSSAVRVVTGAETDNTVVATRDLLTRDVLFTEDRSCIVSTANTLSTLKRKLRTSIVSEHPEVPKVHIRELVSLMLLRLLTRCRDNCEEVLGLPQTTLLSSHISTAYPNHEEIEKRSAWSYASHVILPLQILKVLSGERFILKSRFGAHTSDGYTINTLIALIERSLHVKPDDSTASLEWSGQLLPLCDLAPC